MDHNAILRFINKISGILQRLDRLLKIEIILFRNELKINFQMRVTKLKFWKLLNLRLMT